MLPRTVMQQHGAACWNTELPIMHPKTSSHFVIHSKSRQGFRMSSPPLDFAACRGWVRPLTVGSSPSAIGSNITASRHTPFSRCDSALLSACSRSKVGEDTTSASKAKQVGILHLPLAMNQVGILHPASSEDTTNNIRSKAGRDTTSSAYDETGGGYYTQHQM